MSEISAAGGGARVGSSPATAAALPSRPSGRLRTRSAGSPPAEATRLFITPAREVEITCRLALADYLRLRVPDAAWLIDALLTPRVKGARVSEAGRGSGEAGAATLAALDGLKIVDPACGEGHFLMG